GPRRPAAPPGRRSRPAPAPQPAPAIRGPAARAAAPRPPWHCHTAHAGGCQHPTAAAALASRTGRAPTRGGMKALLLFLANQRLAYRLIMSSGLPRGLALRFVAGERLDDGVTVAQALELQGLRATLDHLGESVASAPEARAASDAYLEALPALHAAGA